MPERDTRFAEWILSLVTTRDKAASVAGDFAETERGAAAFWLSVLRVAVSLLWKDVAAKPGRSVALAGTGIVVEMAFFVPFGTLWFLIASVVGSFGWNGTAAANVVFGGLVASAVLPAPFLAGRWLARRSPGSEFVPCVPLTLLAATLWGMGVAMYGDGIALMNGLSGVAPTGICLAVALISTWSGALWVRRHPSEMRWFERAPRITGTSPVSRDEWQQVFDCLLIALAAAQGIVGNMPTTGHGFAAAIDGLLAITLLANGIAGRPFQWPQSSGPVRLWLGRALFVAVGSAYVWDAWQTLHL
jgi:hypothetical protein